MSLCEQMARQSSNKVPIPINGRPQFASVQEFGGNRQNLPLTGETSTSSSQVMFNPGFSFSQMPICFYPVPAAQPQMQQYFKVPASLPHQQYWTVQQPQYVEVIKPNQASGN